MGENTSENNNILELKSIADIKDKEFIIPSFQRGYRWDIMQVEDLLTDIKEYIDNKDNKSFLCLQPIVVYKKDKKYAVIDGQQRLTTIAIIQSCLENSAKTYNIDYEKYTNNNTEKNNTTLNKLLEKAITNITDEKIKKFINNQKIDDNLKQYDINNIDELFEILDTNYIHKKEKNYHKILIALTNIFIFEKCTLDEYHIILSYLTVRLYFNQHKEYITKFINLFQSLDDKYSIQFIWYNVTEEITDKTTDKINETKAVDIFTRLNIGKIPLTDAELIKALFLKKDNFKDSELDKKLHIAYKWDEIEKTLNNDTFWYFISNRNEDEIQKRNRIELILELAADIKNNNQYKLFKTYENILKGKDISEEYSIEKNDNSLNKILYKLWNTIEECVITLKEWYNDNEMYHYTGYYLYFKNNIHDLYQNIKSKSIYEQKKDISKKVKDILFNDKYKFKVIENGYTNEYIRNYYNDNNNNNDFLNLNFYDKNAKQIFHNILLFIDIYNYINLNKSNNIYNTSQCFFINRFPFNIFKYEKNKQWSLEHIASQKDPEIKDDKRLSFIQDILKELNLINIEIYDSFKSKIENIIGNEYLNTNISINDEQWQQIIEIINNLNSGDTNIDTEKYKNSLCNLALLQKDINSKIGNKPFIIKRNILLSKKYIENIVKIDINKRYIPNNTINAFSKIFNKNAITLIYWTENDMLSYGCYILNILQDFFQLKENNNEYKQYKRQ